jgi:hypothetical protein
MSTFKNGIATLGLAALGIGLLAGPVVAQAAPSGHAATSAQRAGTAVPWHAGPAEHGKIVGWPGGNASSTRRPGSSTTRRSSRSAQ